MKNQLLLEFERHIALGPTYAARLLGYAYPTYAQWRSGQRVVQPYTERHIRTLMQLPRDVLNQQIEEYAHAARKGV